VPLTKDNRTTEGKAALGARAKDRAKDAAAQAVPVGKRAGTTAVQGVRQGVQGAREWAAPRIEDAVLGAREWAAPRIEDAADAVTVTVAPMVAEAVTGTVAPKVSSALRSTARQVRPTETGKTGVRRLVNWRLMLGVGVALAAAGAGAAVAMRRRYASATEEAKNATESPDEDQATQAGEPAGDAAIGSEVNGRVSTPGT
jgi:hypothetical protein